ncbi:putative hemolysin [Photorhabdus tasmaniensis]|uniref:putative hemolysin n=1 Tax=Photorhabdus TaxID=29487 RepID=UPI0036D9E198
MLNIDDKKGFNEVLIGALLFNFTLLAGCSSQTGKTFAQYQAMQYSQPEIGLGIDARATCIYAGGTPALAIQLNGTQTPVCQLVNGKRCDERALLQGSCTPI